MKIIRGNIWDIQYEVKVIPTNGQYTMIWDSSPTLFRAHMGAGLAKEASQRYPTLQHDLGYRLHHFGNQVYIFYVLSPLSDIQFTKIVTFPTKYNWKDSADLRLIEKSAQELHIASMQNNWNSILLPKVGTGLGKLSWNDVEPVLNKYLDERFTVVEL